MQPTLGSTAGIRRRACDEKCARGYLGDTRPQKSNLADSSKVRRGASSTWLVARPAQVA